jgi:hypothetical protein
MTNTKFNAADISDVFPNTFRSDGWQLVFSNIPSVLSNQDLKYFTTTARSVTLPDYNINLFRSEVQGWTIRHPEAPKPNSNFSDILITFKLSENFKNYLMFVDWIRQLKYGSIDGDVLREYTIKKLDVNILDNQKRTIATLGFTNAFLTSLSSLNLDMGVANEVDFSCNFSYEELVYNTFPIFTC